MGSILGLLAPVLGQLAIGDGKTQVSRAMADVALVCLALFGMLAAAGCLVAALWLTALPRFGPVEAPVLCAITLIVVCGVLLTIGTGALRRPKAAPAPAPGSALIELLENIDTERLIRDHKVDLLIGALVVGLVAGGSLPKRPR